MSHQSPHDKAADAVHDGRPVEADYVRGGGKGRRILILLLISLSAVAVLLLGLWAVSQGDLAETNANTGAQAVDAAAFSDSAPVARQPAGPAAAPAPSDVR